MNPDEINFSKGIRGPVRPPSCDQTQLTVRIDTDILEWLRAKANKAGGGNYQRMINRILREAMDDKPPAEKNKVV
jgi:uncharacterized protein (DUF4415 family)